MKRRLCDLFTDHAVHILDGNGSWGRASCACGAVAHRWGGAKLYPYPTLGHRPAVDWTSGEVRQYRRAAAVFQ